LQAAITEREEPPGAENGGGQQRPGKRTAKTRRTPRFNGEDKKAETEIPANFCLLDLNLPGILGGLAVEPGPKIILDSPGRRKYGWHMKPDWLQNGLSIVC